MDSDSDTPVSPVDPLTATEDEVFTEFKGIIQLSWNREEAWLARERETAAALEHVRYARYLRSAPTRAEVDMTEVTSTDIEP